MGEVAELRPELVIARVASSQHGVVTSAQLVAAGWSKDQILGRSRIGWLRPISADSPWRVLNSPANRFTALKSFARSSARCTR